MYQGWHCGRLVCIILGKVSAENFSNQSSGGQLLSLSVSILISLDPLSLKMSAITLDTYINLFEDSPE